jgi:apolipoprotein D and lipocalin family protein
MFWKKQETPIPTVKELNLMKYLGLWFEIGKLPQREQRQLTHVTARYHLDEKGILRVHNTGYRNGKKVGIRGKAWIRDCKTPGALYVQFFWPFKGEYNVIKIAEDYRYAVVVGNSKESLWILARERTLPKEDLREILDFLKAHGIDTKRILKTNQKEERHHGAL